jgi:hypothetical protein
MSIIMWREFLLSYEIREIVAAILATIFLGRVVVAICNRKLSVTSVLVLIVTVVVFYWILAGIILILVGYFSLFPWPTALPFPPYTREILMAELSALELTCLLRRLWGKVRMYRKMIVPFTVVGMIFFYAFINWTWVPVFWGWELCIKFIAITVVGIANFLVVTRLTKEV